MIETNLRIVLPGTALYIPTRLLAAVGSDLTPDLLERACGTLRYRHGLAASAVRGEEGSLLAVARKPVMPLHLEQEDWELDVEDIDAPTVELRLDDDPELVAQLVERSLLATLARGTDLWTLDSPRNWYEPEPFDVRDGIAVYRRYEVSAIPIDGVGVGVAVDVGTAFFTSETLAYFYEPDLPDEERKRRRRLFAELTGRQAGQKGTLLYDTGQARMKCYFESAPEGAICGKTGKIRLKGRSYGSLHEYYHTRHPGLRIDANARAVKVSFRNLGRPQWVGAELVRARVMNDDVPPSLSRIDKIDPEERRLLVEAFWSRLGSRPLGKTLPGLKPGFWRPEECRMRRLAIPELTFGGDRCLPPPGDLSAAAYGEHFRQRSELLSKAGCYKVPPAMDRTLYCAYPKTADPAACRRLAQDLAGTVGDLCRRGVEIELIAYDSIPDAIEKLKAVATSGTALFVLDRDPTGYHETAFQLSQWRIKRVTAWVLHRKYRGLTQGVWDRKTRTTKPWRGRSEWERFVTQNALEVMQLLDVVPYRCDQLGLYEAQLIIDVGHDRSHVALSLLIARDEKCPEFSLTTHVQRKPDYQHEEINPVLLEDQIVALFAASLRGESDPIGSLLVVRDGRFYGRETEGVRGALAKLVERGQLACDARVDLAGLQKDTLKSIRVWEIDDTGVVQNPLEGIGIEVGRSKVVVASTGAATLSQGTAEPYIVTAEGRDDCAMDAAEATFAGAQLNWSNPRVAQRFPLPLKRTDEELTSRAAQEVRRIR